MSPGALQRPSAGVTKTSEGRCRYRRRGMEVRTSTIDDQSLLDFVAGAQPAAETFPTTARSLIRTFARYAAPELPPDVHDEVVSQSLEYLIEYGKQFRPTRGT